MNEETPRKYVTVTASSIYNANEFHIDYVAKGYRLHSQNVIANSVDGVPYKEIINTYSLKDSGKYDDITELVDAPPAEVNDYLAQGYVILETYSKYVRMVKRDE